MNPSLRRIAVVGTSCSGKSTLSGRLAGILGQPHIEMDAFYWGPNWTPQPEEQFQRLISQAIEGDSWIMDGNYGSKRNEVLQRATSIIWLNYDFLTVFRRALYRSLRRALFAEKLFSGNRETFALTFFSRESILRWVVITHEKRRRQYQELRQSNQYPHLRWFEFRKPQEAERFLRELAETDGQCVSERRSINGRLTSCCERNGGEGLHDG